MSSSPPLVTVIVTVHTRTAFLKDALESVIAQRFADYEIIVADDSGSSAAKGIVDGFANRARVTYLANVPTAGIAASLRRALGHAAGRYAAILNDDDAWESDFLARLVPPLEADRRRVLAFSDHWIVGGDGTIDRAASDENTAAYGRADLPEGEVADPARFVIQTNGVPLAMASVFRARAIDPAELVPEVAGAYDFWISILLAHSRGRFYYVPGRLTRYRVHAEMETLRRSPEKSECLVYIWRALRRRGWFAELAPHVRARLAQSTVRAGRDRLYFGEPEAARALFREAFRIAPGWEAPASYLLSVLPRPIRRVTGLSRA